MTTPEGFPPACEIVGLSNADLMSCYIELTGRVRESERTRRAIMLRRASVRDTIIARMGLQVTMRFMSDVERVVRW